MKISQPLGNAWSGGRSSASLRRADSGGPVEVRIEELVLHGFAPGDRHAIAEAVQLELAKLMEQGRLPQSQQNPLAFRQIDAGAFQIERASKAENSGAQIARAVFRGLRQQMRASVYARAGRPGAGGGKR